MVSAVLTDFSPVAIHDLAERPLPPGGLWDPTYPPIPDPPPTPLHWNVCFNDAAERDQAADGHSRRRCPTSPSNRSTCRTKTGPPARRPSLTMVHAGRFIVAPPWDMPADDVDATVIVIEPSMGFGTGHHATTRMCLRLLSDLDVSDLTVLDLGTGSGVLTMAAALSGARRVDRHRRRRRRDSIRRDERANEHAARHARVPGVRLPLVATGARRCRARQPHRRDADVERRRRSPRW